ncbi:MAG TPA: hypothetical protein VJ397_05025 [Thermoplasmata archaeon]|nr:hypothetical protein [Thermoplasmata archaeon]
MPPQLRRMRLKLCVVGDRAVGKTSLVRRYVNNTFSEFYEGTLGSDFHALEFTQHVTGEQIIEARVALFDYMGEHHVRENFRDALFWGTSGFLAGADLSRPNTWYNLPGWINAVFNVAGEVPFRVVFNKADLAPKAIEAAGRWVRTYVPGGLFSVTSAKMGEQVPRAFEDLVGAVVDGVRRKSVARRAASVATSRWLLFAAKRGPMGVTKNELLLSTKGVDHNQLLGEVENLERLGLIHVEEIGPGNFRILITEAGLKVIAEAGREELVVDEAP